MGNGILKGIVNKNRTEALRILIVNQIDFFTALNLKKYQRAPRQLIDY